MPRRTLPALFAAAVLSVGIAVVPALPAAADSGQCTGLGGEWDVPSTTCTLTAPTAITNAGFEVFAGNIVVAAGGTITKTGNAIYQVSGSLTISGTVTVSEGALYTGTASVLGNGALTLGDATNFLATSAVVVNGAGATVTTGTQSGFGASLEILAGTVTSGFTTISGDVVNSGTFVNGGSITGSVTNLAGTFTNTTGTLNGPTFQSGGTLTNNANMLGAVAVSGGTFTNSGAFAVALAGVAISGSGVLVNDGAIGNGVTFSGTGDFTGSGTTTPRYAQTSVFSSAAPTSAAIGGTYAPVVATSVGTTTSFAASPAGVCSLAGGSVSFDGIGTCTVTASRPQNGNFAAASTTQTFAIAGQSQTVTFVSPVPTDATVGGSSTLAATASSGEAVTYSSTTPAVCTVSGSTVTYLAPGNCEVVAAQAGNAQFASASATRSFAVAAVVVPAPPTGSGTGSGLADTGVNPLPGLLVALLTLLAGAGLLAVRRAHAVRS